MTRTVAFSIRSARMEDAEALATIHVRSWQAAYAGLIPQRYLDSLRVDTRRLDRWKRGLAATAWPSTGTLVADVDGRVAAFVGISPSRDDDQDSATVGEVRAIYAEPEAWGRGIGRALMGAALERLASAGFSSATLWVLDTNTSARRFYEAGPWRPDGATKHDDRGEFVLQEVRYRCELSPPGSCRQCR
jgi:GNAT superfamily N-acetyltransferase